VGKGRIDIPPEGISLQKCKGCAALFIRYWGHRKHELHLGLLFVEFGSYCSVCSAVRLSESSIFISKYGHDQRRNMLSWYNYIACFFAGVFLCNFFPHFVNGVSGNRFPTPFAKPPGRGLSTPFVNVLWALVNFIIGFVLIWCGNVSVGNIFSIVVMFAGFSVMSIRLSLAASKKYNE
jgi:hypothetical protein